MHVLSRDPLTVAVGTLNQPKTEAVTQAVAAIWPDRQVTVRPVAVPSGVPEQPMNEQETMRGARNRASAALAGVQAAQLAVGIEGGLCDTPAGKMESTWVCAMTRDGHIGWATTLRMMLPPSFLDVIELGGDLSVAAGAHFGVQDIGQKNGFFGAMTRDAVTRQSAYRDAVCSALAVHIHPDLFKPGTLT